MSTKPYTCRACDPPLTMLAGSRSRHNARVHNQRKSFKTGRLWCTICHRSISLKSKQSHHLRWHSSVTLDAAQYTKQEASTHTENGEHESEDDSEDDNDDAEPGASLQENPYMRRDNERPDSEDDLFAPMHGGNYQSDSEDDLFPRNMCATFRSNAPGLRTDSDALLNIQKSDQSQLHSTYRTPQQLSSQLVHRPSSTPSKPVGPGNLPGNQLTPSRDGTHDNSFMNIYEKTCAEKTEDAKAWLETNINSVGAIAGSGKTRFDEEAPRFKTAILDKVRPGHAITTEQYLAMLADPSLFQTDAARYSFVMCTTNQARMILSSARLYLPLFVPQAKPPILSIKGPSGLYSHLKTHQKVDVHRYDKIFDEQGDNKYAPESMDVNTAIEMMEDVEGPVVNLLNLGSIKVNPVPECIEGLAQYSILHQLRDEFNAGKTMYNAPIDLSSSANFMICGKKGAMSFPHRDHSHVNTTIFCEEGEKLWVEFPSLTDDEETEWNTMDDMYTGPNVPGFSIYMQAGDLLVQPPRRVHAPFSITNVLMTGTMHWYTPDMNQIVQTIQTERTNSLVTNEYENLQTVSALQLIAKLWEEDRSPWPMPDRSTIPIFQSIVKNLSIFCECRNTCGSTKCPCFQAKKSCTERCHQERSAMSKKCKNNEQ